MVIVAASASVLVAGCTGERFDREAMLQRVGREVILPAHEALVREAVLLEEAAVAFREADNPGEADLTALRDRWLAAQVAWKRVQLFQFDRLLLLHNAIEKRPPRADFIERTIRDLREGTLDHVDSDFIAGAGATSKGLGAIEYLLFPSDEEPSVLARADRVEREAYLVALARNLVETARDIRAHWAPEEDNALTEFQRNASDGADLQGSISLLANRMIAMQEVATVQWLGRPLGRTTDGVARPEEAEAARSQRSLELLVASVTSVEQTFHSGLDAYLDHLDRSGGAQPLSARVSAAFEQALRALRAIEQPLEVAVLENPQTVEAAYEAMRALLVLLKTDMPAQLGVTVTFGDNDGD